MVRARAEQRSLPRHLPLALGQHGLEELQVVGVVLGHVLGQLGLRRDLADVDDRLQQVGREMEQGRIRGNLGLPWLDD